MKLLQKLSLSLKYSIELLVCSIFTIPPLFINTHCNSNEKSKWDTASVESFDTLIKNRINPLLFQEQTAEVGRILDSVKNQIAASNFQVHCRWLLAKAEQKTVEDHYDSGKFYINAAISLTSKIDSAELVTLPAKIQLAEILIREKQYDSALHYAHESLFLAQKIDTTKLPLIYFRLSEVHSAIQDMAGFRKYLMEGYKRSGNDPIFRFAFANEIAKYYYEHNEIDSALIILKDLQGEAQHTGKNDLAVITENIGVALTKARRPCEALEYLIKAERLSKEVDIFDAQSMFNLADAYAENKVFKASFSYLDSAERELQLKKDYTLLRRIWHRRANNYRQLSQFDLALSAMDSAYTVYGVELDSSLAKLAKELEAKYNLRQKEETIEELNFRNQINETIRIQQRFLILVLIIALLLLLSVALLLWKKRSMQLAIRESEIRNELLRNQLGPHFVFNTLSILQTDIYTLNREKIAAYLVEFANLLKLSVINVRQKLITLQDELDQVKSYLKVQQMYFESKFDFTIDVVNINSEDALVPPMLIQPFAENAIVHGLSELSRNGEINIKIEKIINTLHITIEDNGVGLRSIKNNKNSLATTITHERLTILKKQTGKPATLTVLNKEDLHEGSGVRVAISIPFIQEM